MAPTPSRLHQRQRMPGLAPRCGQPRPISLLGRAGRPDPSCFFCIGECLRLALARLDDVDDGLPGRLQPRLGLRLL
eukprot:scaffold30961_cov36-Phaeocystis_antarctica.AAC.1